MNRDVCALHFTGFTHDHTSIYDKINSPPSKDGEPDEGEFCSAISILKRHPMYDCLILVKKYRNCLEGYSLEFPIDRIYESERLPTNESKDKQKDDHDNDHDYNHENVNNHNCKHEDHSQCLDTLNALSACSRRRLVSRFLDGDDPMYRVPGSESDFDGAAINENDQENNDLDNLQTAEVRGAKIPFMLQVDDKGEKCELVHVPVNGLLDRLENYTRSGIAVDSRVYAFAMGLKTAERMMTTKSMKELQETPI